MKYIQIVLDGLGDIGRTPLMMAHKPNIDSLSRSGTVGLYKIKYDKIVQSDAGYLALLGNYYNPPKRGYLEALGIGLAPRKGDICIRGDFATIGPGRIVIDRRAGRDETGLKGICKNLNGRKIRGVTFLVKKSAGHRLVIVLHGKSLSTDMTLNDPMATGVKMGLVKARSSKARFTADILNDFMNEIEQRMARMPVNKKRKFPANTILLRDAGEVVPARSFRKQFGLRACCIAGIPIAKGVARYLGLDVIEVKGATGDPKTNLNAKFAALAKNIGKYDFVFFHINATDILAHDAKQREKTAYIEKIDRHLGKFLGKIDREKFRVVVTCDHRTASSPSYKKYRHLDMPVPFMICGPGVRSTGRKFDEAQCAKGPVIKPNQFVKFMTREKI